MVDTTNQNLLSCCTWLCCGRARPAARRSHVKVSSWRHVISQGSGCIDQAADRRILTSAPGSISRVVKLTFTNPKSTAIVPPMNECIRSHDYIWNLLYYSSWRILNWRHFTANKSHRKLHFCMWRSDWQIIVFEAHLATNVLVPH